MWKEIEITDWAHFNEEVLKLKPKSWIFRGQKDASWELVTSFNRAVLAIIEIKKAARKKVYNRDGYEKEIISLFKSQYHLYLSTNPDDNADFIIELTKNKNDNHIERTLEWLSIMQHYGVPTRLLDWTFSPFVALFFALENAENDSSIYALNQLEMQKLDKATFEGDYKKEVFNNRKEEKSFIWPYEPRFKNERLVRQQGLFLVPSTNFETFDKILTEYGDLGDENAAYKFIIPRKLHYEFLVLLKRLNITHETLFPGIEGFCKSLVFSLLESTSNIKRLQ